MDELNETFVKSAPFDVRRGQIFAAFEVWLTEIKLVFPAIRLLWVNGGFITHKAWSPADIDVVGLYPPILKAPVDLARLGALLTVVGTPRIQPMGGLVDAHIATTVTADRDFWDDHWSKVTNAKKAEVPGMRKGYVEVKV